MIIVSSVPGRERQVVQVAKVILRLNFPRATDSRVTSTPALLGGTFLMASPSSIHALSQTFGSRSMSRKFSLALDIGQAMYVNSRGMEMLRSR